MSDFLPTYDGRLRTSIPDRRQSFRRFSARKSGYVPRRFSLHIREQ
jgi:hypothetical protein